MIKNTPKKCIIDHLSPIDSELAPQVCRDHEKSWWGSQRCGWGGAVSKCLRYPAERTRIRTLTLIPCWRGGWGWDRAPSRPMSCWKRLSRLLSRPPSMSLHQVVFWAEEIGTFPTLRFSLHEYFPTRPGPQSKFRLCILYEHWLNMIKL